MSDNTKPETRLTVLHVEATAAENVPTMRSIGAVAELPDGRMIAVDPYALGNGVQVTIYSKDRKNWTAYSLSAEALAQAALQEGSILVRCKVLKPNNELVDGCGWQGHTSRYLVRRKGPCPSCNKGVLLPVDRTILGSGYTLSHFIDGVPCPGCDLCKEQATHANPDTK